MKNNREKYRPCMGFAFSEEKDMKMLSDMAAKGWIFYKFKWLGYKFKKGESQDLIYNLDTFNIKEEDKSEYLEFFQAAGWNHVCSIGDLFHFFSAKAGTLPIYSDKKTKQERNNRGIKDLLKVIGYILLFNIVIVTGKYFMDKVYINEFIDLLVSIVVAGSLGYAFMLIICILFMKFKKRKI